jgi:hypothetical protein
VAISSGGGLLPKWSHSSRELFYRTADQKVMVVTYTATGDSFQADKPQISTSSQFTGRGPNSNLDVHPDGKHFAALEVPSGDENSPVNKVTFYFNFFDELRRKSPTEGK